MAKEKAHHFLSEDQTEKVALRFRMLGEPMRLRILQAVCRRERSVNEIAEMVCATQANVSRHLSLLAGAGILQREKVGLQVYYRMKDSLAMKLCQLVRQHLGE